MTCFRLFSLEITLTENGLENYMTVIDIVFEYIKMAVKELQQHREIRYFNDLKKANDLNYLLYTIDTEVGDHICDIAGYLIFYDDPS